LKANNKLTIINLFFILINLIWFINTTFRFIHSVNMLKYDATHIVAISVVMFGLIFSGLLIKKYTGRYENVEILWVVWWFIIVLIIGLKFL